MSSPIDSNEVVMYRGDARGVAVVEVSEATFRWSRRECFQGPELRRIRRPFKATIEKTPNLCGPVLRLASTPDELRERTRRRSNPR